MLGDFEKMVVVSSTTNEWPQNHIDEKGLMASNGRMVMEKAISQDQQPPPPQQALKCPRCDSSNTKFCYYNNYSLSQPRHFCKACKRYWTRGGTLRNVPVGGGCRKNKRVKRPSSASSSEAISSASTAAATNINPSVQSGHLDLSSTSSHVNPLFYGLPTNLSELNLPYQRLNAVSGFDLQPLGLGFSSRLVGSDASSESYRNGFNSSKPIQDPIFSGYPLHGSSSTSNSTSTLASLIASSFHQQKLVSSSHERFKDIQGGGNNLHGLIPFENMHVPGNNIQAGGIMMKEMKRENILNNQNHQIQQQINYSSSDPSLWNTNSVGAWLDPSSVPSLI